MAYEGIGVAHDYKQSASYYRLAAEQGHAGAQYNLGQMNRLGQGGPPLNNEAKKWYKLAAEQGVIQAQFNLGMLFFMGKPEPEEPLSAFMWWMIAASQGDRLAEKNLELLIKDLSDEQRVKGLEQASAWVEKFGGIAAFKAFSQNAMFG